METVVERRPATTAPYNEHMLQANTKTDPDTGWRIVDEVTQLREWGTDRVVQDLTRTGLREVLIGSSPPCALRIDDSRVSRRHARLARDRAIWWIQDLDSKNGTWIDGVRRTSATLAPGTELTIGPVTVVAESRDFIALRELICRWVGWTIKRRPEVDRALRGVRELATGRLALVLHGDGDLVPIAARLHRELLGPDRKFVVHAHGTAITHTLAEARGGTVCFSSSRVPPDIEQAAAALRTPMSRTRAIVCSKPAAQASNLALQLEPTIRVDLPPLAERKDELPRIIEDYAREFADGWSTAPVFDRRDVPALCAYPHTGLAEIEDSARRLVAMRGFGVTGGAQRLGITHGALSTWAKRHGLRS